MISLVCHLALGYPVNGSYHNTLVHDAAPTLCHDGRDDTPPGAVMRASHSIAEAGWVLAPRRALPVLAALAIGGAIAAIAAPFDAWRTPIEMAQSADPISLLPGMRIYLEPWSEVLTRWLLTAALAILAGAVTWAWRGGTAGYGFFAACFAVSVTLAIELLRWFKPGHLPDFNDLPIAAVVAPVTWRLLRLLPSQPETPLPLHGPCATRRRILIRFLLLGFVSGLTVLGAGTLPAIDGLGLTPGQVQTVIESLPAGRQGLSATVTGLTAGIVEQSGIAGWLRGANRLDPAQDLALPLWAGARDIHAGTLPSGRIRSVNTIAMLAQAMASAEPGDVILVQPGTYAVTGRAIGAERAGTAEAPIVVRAARPGLVTVTSDQPTAFEVRAAHWRFENLDLSGVCQDDSQCDNAFHIAGAAENTVLRNLRIADFNAHIKINGERGRWPDNGRISHVTLTDTRPRRTTVSVVAIDLVGANNWVVEDSLIADIAKSGGDRVSYGAYAKGAAHGTRFARNVVLCAWRLRDPGGARVGLSFGGGGTGGQYTRDHAISGYEHIDGSMTANLIAFCSDDGIYLNRAAGTMLRHNTLLGTAGIDARFPESLVRAEANVVDGAIRTRDGGEVWGEGNTSETLAGMFLGRNPVRALFASPAALDLRWRQLPDMVDGGPELDLCGAEQSRLTPPGAFRDFRMCEQNLAR